MKFDNLLAKAKNALMPKNDKAQFGVLTVVIVAIITVIVVGSLATTFAANIPASFNSFLPIIYLAVALVALFAALRAAGIVR